MRLSKNTRLKWFIFDDESRFRVLQQCQTDRTQSRKGSAAQVEGFPVDPVCKVSAQQRTDGTEQRNSRSGGPDHALGTSAKSFPRPEKRLVAATLAAGSRKSRKPVRTFGCLEVRTTLRIAEAET